VPPDDLAHRNQVGAVGQEDPDAEVLELPSPDDVPVIWERPLRVRGVVVPIRRREAAGNDDSVT